MTQAVTCSLGTIGVLLAAAASSAQVRDARQADLALTLDCVDSTHITFAIRNGGESATAVRLGSVIANGGQYTVDDLQLRQKTPSGQITESHYWPRRYPDRIGGALAEWIQPIPARSSCVISADSNDFWGFRQPIGRMGLPF